MTISFPVKGVTAGTATNTAVVVVDESETSTADNSATTTTQVIGVFTPPSVCATLKVSVKSLTVGKKSVLRIVVRDQRGKALKGAKVIVKGAGVNKSGKTNKKGVLRLVVTPRSPGILQIAVPKNARCARRVGVIGVFQPPVTG